jgi:hypothetical protein
MGSDEYTKALSVAEKELARLNAEADGIAQRRAQLQQTISTLRTLTNGSEQEERTLTDAIRIIVKAADGYILGYHRKTGHTLSVQNRPTGLAEDVIVVPCSTCVCKA